MISYLCKAKKAIPCNYIGCTSTFTSNTNLVRHLKEHQGEKPHVCHFCNKSFGRSFTLRRHLVIHTGEKPYKCEHAWCNKSFNTTGNLSRHKRIHLKPKKTKKDKQKSREKCVELISPKINKLKMKHPTEFFSQNGTAKKRNPTVGFLDKQFNAKTMFQPNLEPFALTDERKLMDSFDLSLLNKFVLDDDFLNDFNDANELFLPTSSELTVVHDNSIQDLFDPFFAKHKCYRIINEIEEAVKMTKKKVVIESLSMKMSACVRLQFDEILNNPANVHQSFLNDSRDALLHLMRSVGSLYVYLNAINFDVLILNSAQLLLILRRVHEVKEDAVHFSKSQIQFITEKYENLPP